MNEILFIYLTHCWFISCWILWSWDSDLFNLSLGFQVNQVTMCAQQLMPVFFFLQISLIKNSIHLMHDIEDVNTKQPTLFSFGSHWVVSALLDVQVSKWSSDTKDSLSLALHDSQKCPYQVKCFVTCVEFLLWPIEAFHLPYMKPAISAECRTAGDFRGLI